MNRRDFILKSVAFTLLAGIGLNACDNDLKKTQLKKLSSNLDRKKLLFLLRKCTLGFSIEQLQAFEKLTLEETITKLIETKTNYSLPLNFEFEEDKLVPIGKTWINAPYRTDVFYEQYRKKSLRAWLISFTHDNPCSIRQQMMYFWLNFYSISDVLEHKYEYKHLLYLHDHAFGNFKQITLDITLDPAMLRFLSGFENTKESPNENYARELLELFTIGRREIVSKGDYTTFTEKDISIISKALSGWTDTGWFAEDSNKTIGTEFKKEKHDYSAKQLSNRFDNSLINPTGEDEYKQVIDLIFLKKETAMHFTKRLYTWFCADEITQEAETHLIFPLAELLLENNYEIKPVIEAMLSSEYFYKLLPTSARIKNPVQYTFNLLHFFPISIPNEVKSSYQYHVNVFENITKMGMELLKPPSVGGWKAYYQAPGFSKLWINSASLKNKKTLVNKITEHENTWSDLGVQIHYSKLVAQSKCKTATEFIDFLNEYHFNSCLDTKIKNELKLLLCQDCETIHDHKVIQQIVNNEPKAIHNLKEMLNQMFNLPQTNIC